jgi:hypothetical protein
MADYTLKINEICDSLASIDALFFLLALARNLLHGTRPEMQVNGSLEKQGETGKRRLQINL